MQCHPADARVLPVDFCRTESRVITKIELPSATKKVRNYFSKTGNKDSTRIFIQFNLLR